MESFELKFMSNKGLNLDVSLFERLVVNRKYPFVTLSTQHRMRPEISALIRGTYPKVSSGDHQCWLVADRSGGGGGGQLSTAFSIE